MFGFSSAANLVDEDYVYNNKVGGIYLYYPEYATPGLSAAGTVTSKGTIVATGGLSAIGGAALYAGISALVKKKRKDPETA